MSEKMSESWNRTVLTALMGTERQAVPEFEESGALGVALRGVRRDSAESALLDTAGLLSQQRRAIAVPPRAESRAEACPAETLPVCTAQAAEIILKLVRGERWGVLGEIFSLIAGKGHRLPHRMLPELLEAAAKNVEMRTNLMPIIGQHGKWLGKEVKEWKFASGADLDRRDWEEGTTPARVLMLKRLRARNPAEAREWVMETWAQDAAAAREEFVRTFEIGLSLDDEQFLERALDDRSQKVREAAANMLGRLPESQYAARMTERAIPLIRMSEEGIPLLNKKSKLEAVLPESYDPSWARDGITEKAPSNQVSPRAHWYAQILSSVPPSAWNRHFGLTAAKIISIAKDDSGWKKHDVMPWMTATINYRDSEWALAFLERGAMNIDFMFLSGLYLALSDTHRMEYLTKLVEKMPTVGSFRHLVLEFLRYERRPFGKELTRLLSEKMFPGSTFETGEHQKWPATVIAMYIAEFGDPSFYSVTMQALTTIDQSHTFYKDVLNYLELYRQRYLLHEEYSSLAHP